MKKSLLVLALVTAAGTAAAQTATTPPVGSGTVTTPSVGSGTATTPTPMQPPTTSMPSAGAPSATAPTTTMPSATPPSVATTPPASSGGMMAPGEAQARARIERDGYKNVGSLTKGPDGMWRGTAMRGSTSVQVMVDARGNVVTE